MMRNFPYFGVKLFHEVQWSIVQRIQVPNLSSLLSTHREYALYLATSIWLYVPNIV